MRQCDAVRLRFACSVSRAHVSAWVKVECRRLALHGPSRSIAPWWPLVVVVPMAPLPLSVRRTISLAPGPSVIAHTGQLGLVVLHAVRSHQVGRAGDMPAWWNGVRARNSAQLRYTLARGRASEFRYVLDLVAQRFLEHPTSCFRAVGGAMPHVFWRSTGGRERVRHRLRRVARCPYGWRDEGPGWTVLSVCSSPLVGRFLKPAARI